jgi:hypothetical protein
MENDSIRSVGEFTLVELWIDGRLRNVAIGRDAVAAFLQLPPERAGELPDERCQEFVRTRMALVVTAAKAKLERGDGNPSSIVLMREHVGSKLVERRKGDRRRSERRKPGGPSGLIGDRRQGDRRRTDRRNAAQSCIDKPSES